MAVTNDPTGRVSDCQYCHARIEEARLMKGMRVAVWDDESKPVAQRVQIGTRVSHGILVWRTVDQDHGSAVCPVAEGGKHEPGRVRTVSVRDGRSNVRRR